MNRKCSGNSPITNPFQWACTYLLKGREGGTKKGTKHFFVVVFILSFLDILRKYVDTIRMHNTSNENREIMILLLNIF